MLNPQAAAPTPVGHGAAKLPTSAKEFVQVVTLAPTAPKVMAGITAALWFMGIVFPSTENVFAMKATNTYGAHSYVWNLFTAGFFNKYILLALLTCTAFIVVGCFLESWGPVEFVRYVSFANLCTGLCMFLGQIFMYMITFDHEKLDVPVSGGVGIVAALLVTIKQRMPEEPIQAFGKPVGSYTAKDLPGVFMCCCVLSSFFAIAPLGSQCVLGTYFGWLYLRFIQRGEDGLRGDMSDHMVLAYFFPAVLRPLVNLFAALAFRLVCTRSMQSFLDELPLGHAGSLTPPGGAPPSAAAQMSTLPAQPAAPAPAPPLLSGSNQAEAERRRARALKSLEERLNGGNGNLALEPGSTANEGAGAGAGVNGTTQGEG